MRKWVSDELVIEFLNQHLSKNIDNCILFPSNRENKEVVEIYAVSNDSCAPDFEGYFSDFEFGGDLFKQEAVYGIDGVKIATAPSQSAWRTFMAKKFGSEYVEAYSDFMKKHFEKIKEAFDKEIKILGEIAQN